MCRVLDGECRVADRCCYEKKIEMGASELVYDKGFKRGEWKEIIRVDDNLCILRWKENNCHIALLMNLEEHKTSHRSRERNNDVPRPCILHGAKSVFSISLCVMLLAYCKS
jgi:hypothetical protein